MKRKVNEENQSKYMANKTAEEELKSLTPEEIEQKFENVRFIGIDKKGREGFEIAIQVNGVRPSKTIRDRMKITETIATVKALADIKLKQQGKNTVPKDARISGWGNVQHLTSKGKKIWTLKEALNALEEKYKAMKDKTPTALETSLSSIKMLRMEMSSLKSLPKGQDTLITEIADDDIIDEYKAYCTDELNVLPQTVDRRLTMINMMLKLARKKKHFDGKFLCDKFNVNQGNIIYLKDHEVKQVVEWFDKLGKPDHRDCTIALVNLGCRQDDLWRITEADVDMTNKVQNDDGEWVTQPMVYIHASKKGNDRNLKITKQCLPVFKRRFTGSNPKLKLFPYSNAWMRATWDRVRELMGHAKEKGWSPHVLRHTVGSRLAQANMSPQYIQLYLGHKSIQATYKYMHLAPKNTDKCVDILDQINGDSTPVVGINNKTGNIQQLQLSEQQLQQVANYIAKLTAKPNGDLQNRHQETKDAQFNMTDSQTVNR